VDEIRKSAPVTLSNTSSAPGAPRGAPPASAIPRPPLGPEAWKAASWGEGLAFRPPHSPPWAFRPETRGP